MKSSAVLFTGKDQVSYGPIEVQPPAPSQVLVETSCSLVSTGTETIVLSRKFSPGTNWDSWVKYPFQPGYCSVGKVLEVGSAVRDFAKGQRVATWSGHQQHVLSGVDRTALIPEGVSDEEASWLPMAVIAQHGFRLAEVRLGEVVVVVGLGILGQLVVQYAQLSGARRIIAIDPAQQRLEMAARHGATDLLAKNVSQAVPDVQAITDGELAPVLFDMTGHPQVFSACHQLLAPRGRLVMIGDCGTPEAQHLTSDFMVKNLRVIGAHQRMAALEPIWNHNRMGKLFLELVSQRRMRVDDLITHRFPVQQAAQAYRLLNTQRDAAMGVIFQFA